MTGERIAPCHVVIAGGGVAALEALMALHDLGEHRLRLTVIAPEPTFRLRPMAVAVPFSAGHVTEVRLDDVCRRFGADLRQTTLLSVDAPARRVRCGDGQVVSFDALVVATGARAVPAFPAALTFSDTQPEALNGLLRDLEEGWSTSVAVVVPPEGSWPLPAYELALLIAHDTRGVDSSVEVHLVTPEPVALSLFGPAAGHAVTTMLEAEGVQLHPDAFAQVGRGGHVQMNPGGRTLDVDRVVALPRMEGRAVPGLPADGRGFIPVDEHGRVRGVPHVYAAGDGADFPVKQGGLAAQQADAVAAHIASLAGASVDPAPFRPVLRGMLLTGQGPRFMRGEPTGGRGEGRISDRRLWWPPVKVVGHFLSPWLAGEDPSLLEPPPAPHVAIDVELPTDPLALDPLGPVRFHPSRA